MKKTKVLHVVGKMNIGGAEVLLMNVFRNIDKAKYKFDFLVYDDGSPGYFDNEIIELGGNLVLVPAIRHFDYKYNVDNIVSVLVQNKYDVIHTHIGVNAVYAFDAAKKCGVPIRICHSHSIFAPKGNFFKRKRDMYYNRMCNEYLTKCCACSKEAAYSRFSKNNIQDKYEYIPNAIDFQRYTKSYDVDFLRNNLCVSDKKVLVQVGNIKAAKNQMFSVELLSELHKEDRDFVLLLVGRRSDYADKVERKARDLGVLQNIMFLGQRDDIPELLAVSDVFLMPSVTEGLGICALEAQASGLPCVVSENVPVEADMGMGLFRQCKLNDMKSWVNTIGSSIKEEKISIEKRIDGVKRSDFDIMKTVKLFEKLYSE